MTNSDSSRRRAVTRRGRANRRGAPQGLLERILNTPHVEHVIPGLAPEVLHRVIQHCGLEDCGELVALATPDQLRKILDLDLWRPGQPGRDEQFDADRFGAWLEVLREAGAEIAARQLASMDIDLVVAGIAQHARVFDRASMIDTSGAGFSSEVGGYLIAARQTGSWNAIVDTLGCLHSEHHDFFNRVMRGCRRLSNSDPEVDGLHDLLTDRDQAMFDLVVDRERRREEQGFATPADARAFLQLSRQFRHEREETAPEVNLAARAYFRSVAAPAAAQAADAEVADDGRSHAHYADAVTTVVQTLREAGVMAAPPRALLENPEPDAPKLARMQALMQVARDRDPAAFEIRSQELAHLANILIAGCSLQNRSFTGKEASTAAVAVCNLGLENWPVALPGRFLLDHDLVSVFQAGWAFLYEHVCLYAASQLGDVLTRVRCEDRSIQRSLEALRLEIGTHSRDGAPWRARDALDVIALLDLPAWVALLALIDECPVLHAAVAASRRAGTLRIDPGQFEFFSENSQIAMAREFLHALPDTLSG